MLLLAKEIGQFLNMAYAWIFDFAPRDLLDGALADARANGDLLVGQLCGIELGENVIVEGQMGGFIHKTDDRPFFGSTSNPPLGLCRRYTYNPMSGSRKTPKIAGAMRAQLASRVKDRMEVQYRDESNKPKALAKNAGVSLSTVQRVLKGEVGASIDSIEALAQNLGVPVTELFADAGKHTTTNVREIRQQHTTIFDRELLREVFVVLENGLAGHPMTPNKKMQALEMAYDVSLSAGRVDRVAVERLLRLVTSPEPTRRNGETRRVRKGGS